MKSAFYEGALHTTQNSITSSFAMFYLCERNGIAYFVCQSHKNWQPHSMTKSHGKAWQLRLYSSSSFAQSLYFCHACESIWPKVKETHALRFLSVCFANMFRTLVPQHYWTMWFFIVKIIGAAAAMTHNLCLLACLLPLPSSNFSLAQQNKKWC